MFRDEGALRRMVRRCYDAGDYAASYRRERGIAATEQAFLDRFTAALPDGGSVLDLGCGPGIPYDAALVREGYAVTGIDLSEEHVRRARENVPGAEFVQGDMLDAAFDTVFDGALCLYAVHHLPRERHEQFFRQIADNVDDGPFLLTVPADAGERVEEWERVGEETAWSCFDADTSLDLLRAAGFSIRATASVREFPDTMEHRLVLATV